MPISFQVILMFSLLKQNWEEKYLRLAISLILLSLLLYFLKKNHFCSVVTQEMSFTHFFALF